ncbi:Fatty acid hydroxylase ahd1 [Dirofilaria immitis]
MYHIAEHQIIEQWIIQIPFTCVLLEIIAICITRSVLAFIMIIKYRRKQCNYYQAPILDSSYFANPQSYVEKYMENPIEKVNAMQKVARNTFVPKN